MAATHALGACVERRVGSSPTLSTKYFWVVISVGREPRLHRGCRRFEPVTTHHQKGQMSEWFKVAHLKCADCQRSVGSNPTLPATIQ
jgi:hypothetical protein